VNDYALITIAMETFLHGSLAGLNAWNGRSRAAIPFAFSFKALSVRGTKALNVSGTHASRIEVNGAGEPVRFLSVAEAHIHNADHPIVTSRAVVDIDPAEVDVLSAEPIQRLLTNGLAAHFHGLISRKSAGASMFVRRRRGRHRNRRTRTEIAICPREVECVSFGAVIGIFDSHYRWASAARIAN
jgi:hypothetical protein